MPNAKAQNVVPKSIAAMYFVGRYTIVGGTSGTIEKVMDTPSVIMVSTEATSRRLPVEMQT